MGLRPSNTTPNATKRKLTRRQLEALPHFDIGDIVWANCGAVYGQWPATVSGERNKAGLYQVFFFVANDSPTYDPDSYGEFTESKLTPFVELEQQREIWVKTALKTAEENAVAVKDKEKAVEKAKASMYERNQVLSYRLIAHAEFKKLQADGDEISQECPHCMEEWADTIDKRLVMMSCDECKTCRMIYHKDCALEIMRSEKVCPKCNRNVGVVAPFSIKEGPSGKIKIEGQEAGDEPPDKKAKLDEGETEKNAAKQAEEEAAATKKAEAVEAPVLGDLEKVRQLREKNAIQKGLTGHHRFGKAASEKLLKREQEWLAKAPEREATAAIDPLAGKYKCFAWLDTWYLGKFVRFPKDKQPVFYVTRDSISIRGEHFMDAELGLEPKTLIRYRTNGEELGPETHNAEFWDYLIENEQGFVDGPEDWGYGHGDQRMTEEWDWCCLTESALRKSESWKPAKLKKVAEKSWNQKGQSLEWQARKQKHFSAPVVRRTKYFDYNSYEKNENSEENTEERALSVLSRQQAIMEMGPGFVQAGDLVVTYYRWGTKGFHGHELIQLAFVARKVAPHGEKASPWTQAEQGANTLAKAPPGSILENNPKHGSMAELIELA